MSPSAMRSFDPRRVGERECATWVTYYRRQWWRFLFAAVAVVRQAFALGPLATVYGAVLVLRANQLWAPQDNDPDGARRCMRRFYALVDAVAPPDVRLAAELRALAMRHSDRWVAAGCPPESPLIAAERAALVRSYAALLAAVHVLP